MRTLTTAILFLFSLFAAAQKPKQVTVCQLKNDPDTYNHQLVEVSGFVSHAFEDFTVFDPDCGKYPNIWLEYGGATASGTMYCCGVTGERTRPQPLTIEDVPIKLIDDDTFREFDKEIQPPFRAGNRGSIVHATLIGHFFAGRRPSATVRTFGRGYGHMGCCSLLAIEEVKEVEPQSGDDLDYGASSDQPDLNQKCGSYSLIIGSDDYGDMVRAQRAAEAMATWPMQDPGRVAAAAIAKHLNRSDAYGLHVREIQRSAGVREYQWKADPETVYLIVVSRPYVLSFYARDPTQVAWVTRAAYKSTCANDDVVKP